MRSSFFRACKFGSVTVFEALFKTELRRSGTGGAFEIGNVLLNGRKAHFVENFAGAVFFDKLERFVYANRVEIIGKVGVEILVEKAGKIVFGIAEFGSSFFESNVFGVMVVHVRDYRLSEIARLIRFFVVMKAHGVHYKPQNRIDMPVAGKTIVGGAAVYKTFHFSFEKRGFTLVVNYAVVGAQIAYFFQKQIGVVGRRTVQ